MHIKGNVSVPTSTITFGPNVPIILPRAKMLLGMQLIKISDLHVPHSSLSTKSRISYDQSVFFLVVEGKNFFGMFLLSFYVDGTFKTHIYISYY